MRYEAILLLLLLLAAGCAERAWIRSAPPGANVYVNGHFIGITPVVYWCIGPSLTDHSGIGSNATVMGPSKVSCKSGSERHA